MHVPRVPPVVWFVSALMLLPMMTRAEVAADYLQGYARAVLDVQFAQHSIEVVSAHDDGRLILSDGGCGNSDAREAIETGIEATGRFARVLWQETPSCVQAQAAAMQPAAGPVTAAPTPLSTPTKQAQPLVTAVEALPVDELFKPLIADPRQPQFSLRYHRYEAAESFNAASVSFGDYFGFASGVLKEYGISQIGLQGAVFALFNLDAPSQDLINADYWIGVPLSFRRGPFSYLTRIYHQSSHLGDEFLLGNIGDLERINLSYEDWETLVSYDWRKWRFYGGGGVILHSEPDIEPLHLQGGAEFRRPHFLGKFNLVAALDMQATQEQDWHLNSSYQAGFAFGGDQGREVRLMLEHYRGFSPNGQFYTDKLHYSGVGVYFDF